MNDNSLNGCYNVSTISKKASRQINAIMRLSNVLDTEVKETILSSFIRSNFSYCPVVWMFSGQTNIKKLQLLQYCALKFVYNDFETSFTDL